RQREAVPFAEFAVQPAQVRGAGGEGLSVAARGVAQAGEIEHGHAGHLFPPASLPALPKSRLPPRLPASFAGPITIACESALHMSYTVSAATVAPVRASISTPVRCTVFTVHSIRSSRSPCQSIASFTPSIGSGWQNGISSWVRLTAMVPAITAVSTIPPLALRRPLFLSSAATAAGNLTRHSATASRAVTALPETSTIAGR